MHPLGAASPLADAARSQRDPNDRDDGSDDDGEEIRSDPEDDNEDSLPLENDRPQASNLSLRKNSLAPRQKHPPSLPQQR